MPAPGRYTKPERDRALAKLQEYAFREFDEVAAQALELFWGAGPPDGVTDRQYSEVIASEPGRQAFTAWFLFDFPAGAHGSPADDFAHEAAALSEGERAWLDMARAARLRVYEILEVRRDEGFLLRDLWSGDVLDVRERQATRQLVKWELLAARLVEGPQGHIVIESAPYALNPESKGLVQKLLKRLHRKASAEGRRAGTFLELAALGLNQIWLTHVVFPPMPEMRTPEGDAMVFCRTQFRVHDAAAVRAALLASGDFEAEGESGPLVWLVPGEGARRILGTLEIRNERLTLETMSDERAERGRALVERLAGKRVSFRVMRVQTVEQAMSERRGGLGAPEVRVPRASRFKSAVPRKNRADEIPPAEQAELLKEHYDKHYREWLDIPVPALKNRTPRAAAKLKSARPALIELLKTIESRMERERRDGRVAYDTGWIWGELGVAATEA